jgi:hypothetical protein
MESLFRTVFIGIPEIVSKCRRFAETNLATGEYRWVMANIGRVSKKVCQRPGFSRCLEPFVFSLRSHQGLSEHNVLHIIGADESQSPSDA